MYSGHGPAPRFSPLKLRYICPNLLYSTYALLLLGTFNGDAVKILLATDGSDYSDCAAQFLGRLAWTPEDTITVFHAIYAVPFREDEQFHFDTLKAIKIQIAPKIIDSAVALLQNVRANLSAEIDEFAPSQCTPEQCIIDAAQLAGADLVVMGARGLKGVASLLVGSVTKSVALYSPIPLLVVRPTPPARSGSMKILFAVDGSDSSFATGELLSSLPFPSHAALTLLHVLSPAFGDVPAKFLVGLDQKSKDVVERVRTREEKDASAVLEQAKRLIRKTFKHIQSLSKIGDPSTEILKTAEMLDADLIVLGSRGLRGVKGMLGSVSRNVLSHAACSVLIGKARQE